MPNLKILVFCRVCDSSSKTSQLLFSNFKFKSLYPVILILGRNVEGKSILNTINVFRYEK